MTQLTHGGDWAGYRAQYGHDALDFSANSGLRNGITEEGRKRGWRTFLPEFKFTTDNAAMIALAGI